MPLMLATSGLAQTTNAYHTNRVFQPITFSIPGVPTAFQVCDMVGQLTTVVGPTNVITNSFYAMEYESMVAGHGSNTQAWAALAIGYPSNSIIHTNHLYDNVGWAKGIQTDFDKMGGYFWVLKNTVNFKTSPTNIWVSTNAVTNAITKVLVGSIGDYPAMTDESDTGPGIAEGLTNFPSGGTSEMWIAEADFTAYYDIGLPAVALVPPLTNVSINTSNIIFTLITNSYVTNGVAWSITPSTNGLSYTYSASNITINVGSLTNRYNVRATANNNTNIYGEAALNVVWVDIVQTQQVWSAGNSNNAEFNLTTNSSTNVTWLISPNPGTTGARFAAGPTGAGTESVWHGTNAWISAGSLPTTYTVRAYASLLTNCHDTATLIVITNYSIVPSCRYICLSNTVTATTWTVSGSGGAVKTNSNWTIPDGATKVQFLVGTNLVGAVTNVDTVTLKGIAMSATTNDVRVHAHAFGNTNICDDQSFTVVKLTFELIEGGLRRNILGDYSQETNPTNDARIFTDTDVISAGGAINGTTNKQCIKLKVRIQPDTLTASDLAIRWEASDPDDSATNAYLDADGEGGDNLYEVTSNSGNKHEGEAHWFSEADHNIIAGSQSDQSAGGSSNTVIGQARSELATDAGSLYSSAYFNASDDGGDNFKIKAVLVSKSDSADVCELESGMLTVWRKRSVEYWKEAQTNGAASGFWDALPTTNDARTTFSEAYGFINSVGKDPDRNCYIDAELIDWSGPVRIGSDEYATFTFAGSDAFTISVDGGSTQTVNLSGTMTPQQIVSAITSQAPGSARTVTWGEYPQVLLEANNSLMLREVTERPLNLLFKTKETNSFTVQGNTMPALSIYFDDPIARFCARYTRFHVTDPHGHRTNVTALISTQGPGSGTTLGLTTLDGAHSVVYCGGNSDLERLLTSIHEVGHSFTTDNGSQYHYTHEPTGSSQCAAQKYDSGNVSEFFCVRHVLEFRKSTVKTWNENHQRTVD